MKTDVFCKHLNGYVKRNKKFKKKSSFFHFCNEKWSPYGRSMGGFPRFGEGSGTVKTNCLERASKENISQMHDFGNFWGDSGRSGVIF